jgi:hypothetical protein
MMDGLGSEAFGTGILLLFAAGRDQPSGSTLTGIIGRVEAGALILGGAAVYAADRAGMEVRGSETTAPDTLLLACRRADLMSLGGLDPALSENLALASAEIALRASLVGMPIFTAASVQPAGAAWQSFSAAQAALQARWRGEVRR